MTADNTTIEAKDILRSARKRIERMGWCQHRWSSPEGPACLVGHLRAAVGCISLNRESELVGHPTNLWSLRAAKEAIAECLSTPGNRISIDELPAWNDRPGRTVDEVKAVLDCAISRVERAEPSAKA